MRIVGISRMLMGPVLFVSIQALALSCDPNQNNPSLLVGAFAFRFDVQAPVLEPVKGVVPRPLSILGVAYYSGDGKAFVVITPIVTDSLGVTRSLEQMKLAGIYCAYPNGWRYMSFSNASGSEVWQFASLTADNGQQLETLLNNVLTGREYAVTFSQKKVP